MSRLKPCPYCGREVGDRTGSEDPLHRLEVNDPDVNLLRAAHPAANDSSKDSAIGLFHYILNHIFLATLILIVAHYTMIFILGVSAGVMNLTFMAIAFLFGYDMFARRRTRLGVAFIIGLTTGVVAVIAMSTVVTLILGEPFFPSARSRQDFFESTAAIMLAYVAGAAMAGFLRQVLPASFASETSFVGIINGIVELARPDKAQKVSQRLQSLDTIIKGIVAVVLSIGALMVALKGILK